jgi:septum site-determining protein MinC
VQGALFTMMVLPAGDPQDPNFEAELAEQVGRSPGFYVNAPLVIDLKGNLGFLDRADFDELRELLLRHKLIPIGVQHASPAQQRAALAAGLSCFAGSSAPRRTAEKDTATEPAPIPPPSSQPVLAQPASGRSRLITQPIRSGAQIYAKGCDLIVVSSVSSGAEIIADGHIHVYGTLRGRAVAGAVGDREARIFASRLEAELLSIAGCYLVRESIPAEHIGQPAQIHLDEDKLVIARN